MRLQPLTLAIALTGLLTAVIHFSLDRTILMLNGLGYLALLAAYLLPWPPLQQRRDWVRRAFAAYTLLTIVLYFATHPGGSWQSDGLGLFTKLVELILLLLLLYDGQRDAAGEAERT